MPNQFDKSKLPSRHVSVGPERAPHRSYYYAMGLTAEEIARPFVGVVSAGNDSAPCNTTLDAQADIARKGVEQGGGMPRRFNTITVTDGIAMGHQSMKSSLASREAIADSIETLMDRPPAALKEMGQRGRDHVRANRSWRQVAGETADILADVSRR